jgi:Luciferase
MASLKKRLEERLRRLPGLEVRPSPVAGGTALFFRGREFAHFHSANELDLRLTK